MSSSAMASLPSLRFLSLSSHSPPTTAKTRVSTTRVYGSNSHIRARNSIQFTSGVSSCEFDSEPRSRMCPQSLSFSSAFGAPAGLHLSRASSADVRHHEGLRSTSAVPSTLALKRFGGRGVRRFTVRASFSQFPATASARAHCARRFSNNVRQFGVQRNKSTPALAFPSRTPRDQKLRKFAVKALAASPGYQYMVIRDHSLPQRIRAVFFYMWTLVLATPLVLVMAAIQPLVLAFDRNRRKAQHLMNRLWATLSIIPFYKVEIIGRENLPSMDEGAVYVANHQSFLDIYTLFLLGRPFKFISKTSNFLIPVIGWAMYLTGHVPLRRLDKRSQMECLKKCIDLVKVRVPVLFFPEGTRSSDGKMAAFKKGAFIIATKGNVPVVPISLIGTGKLMPNGLESTLRPGKVKVIIHPPIKGQDADELCKQTREVIGDTLLQHGLAVL